MSKTADLLEAHPNGTAVDQAMLAEVLEAITECAQTCNSCADACLGGDNVEEMQRCIRLCMDCTDICGTAGRVLGRQTEFPVAVAREMTLACVTACGTCAEECESHGPGKCGLCGQTCKICAETCRRCEEVCRKFAVAVAA